MGPHERLLDSASAVLFMGRLFRDLKCIANRVPGVTLVSSAAHLFGRRALEPTLGFADRAQLSDRLAFVVQFECNEDARGHVVNIS